MNEKRKWITATRLRRGAGILAATGLMATAGLGMAGSALAGVGSQPGDLVLSPASGPLSTQATWSTTVACPTGFQGSANITEYVGTTSFGLISNTIESPTAPFNGLFDGTVGALLGNANLSGSAPGTSEWVVNCYSGPTASGSQTSAMSEFVSVAAGATTYTTSATGPVQTATTTTLTATPANPVASGASVSLSAAVSAADGTTPAGTVQFEANGTDIGAAVAVNTGGTSAPATTTFTAPTTTSSASVSLTVVFSPTATTYAGSTGSYTLNVVNTAVQTAGAIPVDVTVPATGTLSVTVSTTAVSLGVTGTTAPLTATGTLNTVSVSDGRNTVPGWSVMGQDTAFTGSGTAAGSTIPGDDMGWAPTCATLATGAICGSTVAPGASPGLADAAQVLASAAPGGGTGSSSLSAALTLDIPTTALAGPYTSTLTITYLITGP